MQRTPLLAILLAVFVLQSCQKELNPFTQENPTTPTVEDSNFLWRVYEVDTTVMPFDSLLAYQFNYDGSRRVASITSAPDIGLTDSTKVFFFYTGSDTLPYKSLIRGENFNLNGIAVLDTTSALHYYDALGRKIKDSIFRSANNISTGTYRYSIRVHEYSYAVGRIYEKSIFTEIDASTGTTQRDLYTDTALLDAQNNIISNKEYIYDSSAMKWHLLTQGTYTYDNKINPFYKLSISKAFSVIPELENSLIEAVQRHNMLSYSQSHNYSGSPVAYFNEIYQYQYLTNGYPKECSFTVAPPSKVVFVYKAL